MTNIKKNAIQPISSNEEILCELIERDVRSDSYQVLFQQECRHKMPHPSANMLYNYVLDMLEANESQIVQNHLTFCGQCADEVLRMIRIEEEIEFEEQSHDKTPNPFELRKLDGVYQEALMQNIATEYWEPRYAGMELVSADMKKQTREFQEGQIKISTYWEGARGGKSAYIWLAWTVSVPQPYHLIIKFFQPETGCLLYEINLGETKQGEETFTSDDLHFDPTAIRWAITADTRPL